MCLRYFPTLRMTPDEYCEQKTAGAGSSFSYSFLFLDPDERRAMTVLYAFCREVDDVVDECSAPSIAGMHLDLDCIAYRSFEELSLYCYRAAAAVGLRAAEIFGYEDRATLKYANDLGMAFQLTNILRDVGEDARRGRVYIPEEDMARYGVTREDILDRRDSEALRKLMRQQAERARAFYTQAFAHLPDADRYRQRSGIIMAAVYQALLQAIEDGGFDVFGPRVRLSPSRKVWIAWQTARREKRQHLGRVG